MTTVEVKDSDISAALTCGAVLSPSSSCRVHRVPAMVVDPAVLKSLPYLLWRWYVDTLVYYAADSWVASAARTFRILAVLMVLPFAGLTLLVCSLFAARKRQFLAYAELTRDVLGCNLVCDCSHVGSHRRYSGSDELPRQARAWRGGFKHTNHPSV